MKLEFQEYRARKIVNVHPHVDGPWFWGKYTAHPYVGCRSGCAFCYTRGSRYLGQRDPHTFDTLIQVKVNAVELLRKELPRLARETISCGDWQQPAEERYRLSRGHASQLNGMPDSSRIKLVPSNTKMTNFCARHVPPTPILYRFWLKR